MWDVGALSVPSIFHPLSMPRPCSMVRSVCLCMGAVIWGRRPQVWRWWCVPGRWRSARGLGVSECTPPPDFALSSSLCVRGAYAVRMSDVTVSGHNGQLSFDGETVTITRTGFLARMSAGDEVRRIPVSAMTGVQYTAPSMMTNGFIRFTLPGDSAAVPAAHQEASDRNAVMVVFGHRREAAQFVDAVRAAIAAAAGSGGPVGEVEVIEAPKGESVADRVDRAGAALDRWVDGLPSASLGGSDGALTLYADRLEHRKGLLGGKESVPLSQDVQVRVESGSALESRVTMTRLVALGIFAFAAKKKRGGEVFVTVESPDVFWMVEVPRKGVGQARRFVAAVEAAKRQAPGVPMSASTSPSR